MRNLLHSLVAHPLHGLLWWAGLHKAALAVHAWWAPVPPVRHFHIAYVRSVNGQLETGDIALQGRGILVCRGVVNTWRRVVAHQVGAPPTSVSILGWQEYEAGQDWS